MMPSRLLDSIRATLLMGVAIAMVSAHAQEQPVAKPEKEVGVHEFTLENGLKLVVKEDHRAPVVSTQVWYRVGSAYEPEGKTGVSHVLEHMMFKGTQTRGPNEFSQIVAANGGVENAFTSRDYTAYHQRIEKSKLPLMFELEADRMRNLLLDKAEFNKERRVVMEERRLRTDDSPRGKTYEQLYATAFQVSPYRHPVIGWTDDLKNLTLDDMREWYTTWYAPNNATVVVVGDVRPAYVHRLAKRTFGKLEPQEIKPGRKLNEPEQLGERRTVVRKKAKQPYLLMGYRAPVLATADEDWEVYALDVASSVLDGGDSARLTSELVRGSEIAATAGAGYSITGLYDDLFLLTAIPSEGVPLDELEAALKAQVAKLRDELVSAEELERIKTQAIAEKVYKRDSIQSQAIEIGVLETVGDGWRVEQEYLDRIKAVTAEQVQAVARKYLLNQRLTVALMKPLPLSDSAALSAH
ncbi:MAG: M16 family metallopeptidase [Gammaproteobacteria bacterium]